MQVKTPLPHFSASVSGIFPTPYTGMRIEAPAQGLTPFRTGGGSVEGLCLFTFPSEDQERLSLVKTLDGLEQNNRKLNLQNN